MDTLLARLEQEGREAYNKTAPYRVTVPHGKRGPWTIAPFEIDFGITYLRHARDGRGPGLGVFTKLAHERRGIVMSDTVPEIRDLKACLLMLRGNILITGLGLGMVVHALTTIERYSKHVRSITVIEKDKDVIALVGAHYRKDKRVQIINANAYTWRPGKRRFTCAWHDLWDDIREDNVKLFAKLRVHYKSAVPHGKQFCWGEQALAEERRWG